MTTDMFEDLWHVITTYKYQYMDNIPNEMKCGLCKGLLIVPCSIRCGCRFCHSCITKYLNESNIYCPNKSKFCRLNPIDLDRDVVPDQPMNVLLSLIKVKCINKNCDFSDELSTIEDHIKTCDKSKETCPFYSKGCDTKELDRDKIKDHLRNEIDFHFKLVVQMINNISANPINIDQSGNRALPNLNEELHEKYDKSSVTQQMQQELDSLKVGNQFMMKELSDLKEYKNLNETFILKNFPVINSIYEDLKSVSSENKILKGEFERLTALGEIIKESILKTQIKSESEFQNVINLRTLSEKTYEAQQKLSSVVVELQRKIHELSQSLLETKDLLDKTTKEFRIKTMEIEFEWGKNENNGSFNWKIDNFSKVWNDSIKLSNSRLNSDSFYSKPKGCKMCLRLWWAEEYLWAGFCLIPGPYDNVIEWPCQMDIFISLIDQTNAIEFSSCSLSFKSYPTNEAWKKPRSEKNIGLGEKLIKFDTLIHNTNLIKNDKIYIKCIITDFKDIGVVKTLNALQKPSQKNSQLSLLEFCKSFSLS